MAGDSSASQHLLLKWKGVHETGSTPKGEEIVITRHGKQVARLVPPEPVFDREQARAAVERLRDRAAALKCKITLDEIKAYRDQGRQ